MNTEENITNTPEDESLYEGRRKHFMDIDRMLNEGLGGGQVTNDSGLIEKRVSFPKKESPPTLNGEDLEDSEDITAED